MIESFDLQEALQSLQENDNEGYEIPHEHNPEEEDVERLLEAAVEAVAESSENIKDTEVFDVYRSILKYSKVVLGHTMNKLLDSISSGLQTELEATTRDIEHGSQQEYLEHRQPLEMYVFLLQWFVTATEKVKQSNDDDTVQAPKARRGRGGRAGGKSSFRTTTGRRNGTWTWTESIPATLALICKVLRLQTQRIWTTTAERETFVSCLTRPAYHITETEHYMKVQDIKLGVYKVICLAVKHHSHSIPVQIRIMQSLQFWEHLSEPMAECMTVLAKEFDHAQLGDEILREIASKTFNAVDNKGPRVFARFLVKFAELAPRSVLKQFSLLLRQLDSDSYPMRIAIAEVIAFLIIELAESCDVQDKKQTQRQINGLYDLLLERIMDISSYVRTKVLSLLAKLCDLKPKFPKQRLAVTRAAIATLEDKVSTVRKGAVALIVKLLLTHPYLTNGGHLEVGKWEADYHAINEELAIVEDGMGKAVVRQDGIADDSEGNTEKNECEGRKGSVARTGKEDNMEDIENEEDEGEDQCFMDVDGDESGNESTKKGDVRPRKSHLDVAALSSEQDALAALEADKLLQLRLRKKYCIEALDFINQIEGAIENVCELLGSTNKGEVLEAMEFFRVAHDYHFDSAKTGIKKMIHLVWSKDNSTSTSEDGKELKGIRSRLLDVYRTLYFDPIPDLDIPAKDQINRIAKNMIERTYEATLAELTSLEEMMRIMMDEGVVHQDIVSKLWQVYSTSKSLPKPQRRGAIIILGMLALAKRSVVTDNVDAMLQVGLGALGKSDLQLAKYTCVALQRLNGSAKKVKGSLVDKILRISMDSPIFCNLQATIEAPCRSKEWFSLAEQVINTIYALGTHPDKLLEKIIKNLTFKVFDRPLDLRSFESQSVFESHSENDAVDAMDEEEAPESTVQAFNAPSKPVPQSSRIGEAFELSQLLFIVGHVGIKQLVFLEEVERELKRQKDEKQAAEKRIIKAGYQSKDSEELDQVAGNAEDEIGERVAAMRETEMLYEPHSLLAMFGPLLVHICGSPHKFKNRTLRAAATLSFSKFLCISSQFCEQHHRLLFKILETSRDPNIRSNIVIALGDVAVSFGSVIDDNSNELYKGLSDEDLVVKKNTLMVLTHLILNGMIKVKGQLGEMAKCLEDPNPRISDLAKLFFKELSTKENAIYNNLPDVISHLSTGENAIQEKAFQSTLRYIFTFIEKEKHAENVVEKLCQRFQLTDDPRQWRDIAFCLSLLPFRSERSVKKLIEGLQFYRDKLHEDVVYERFQEILQKARSNKSKDKPDGELDEFERILEENRAQGAEDQALERRVGKKKAVARRRAAKKSRNVKRVTPEDSEPYSD